MSSNSQSRIPSMKRVVQTLTTRFKIKAGVPQFVMGSFTSPSGKNNSDPNEAVRHFLCKAEALISEGNVIIGATGKKYLLFDAGNEELGSLSGYKSFRVVELNQSAALYRKTTSTDPVSKRTIETYASIDTVDYSATILRQVVDTLRIPFNEYNIITDAVLQEGDKLDDKRLVRRVDRINGITVARVSD